METREDCFNWLDFDVIMVILMCLGDPADFIRVSSLSRFWYNFVIANGLCKKLCLRMFPQLSAVDSVVERGNRQRNPIDVGSCNSAEWESLETEHRAFAFLARQCKTLPATSCIADAVCASSTDNYPFESIVNTLERGDRVGPRASYWSSKGQRDHTVPETLVYKLDAVFCFITEINVQPFQAFFQPGDPIYAAKSVRFRVGHPKSPSPLDVLLQKAIQRNIRTDTSEGFSMAQPVDILHQEAPEDGFIWTWTSQEFPMAQENRLQKFKLPKPVLCFGGIVQIELLGRVQRQEMDGLFYICVSHVEVIGGRLFPGFDIEILEPSGKIVLKYFPNLSPIRIRHPTAQPFLIPRLPLLRGGLMQGPLRAFGRMPHLFQRIRQQDESDDPGSQQHEPEPT